MHTDDEKNKPIEKNAEPLEQSSNPLLFAEALVKQLHRKEVLALGVLELSKAVPGDPISNSKETTEESKTPRKK